MQLPSSTSVCAYMQPGQHRLHPPASQFVPSSLIPKAGMQACAASHGGHAPPPGGDHLCEDVQPKALAQVVQHRLHGHGHATHLRLIHVQDNAPARTCLASATWSMQSQTSGALSRQNSPRRLLAWQHSQLICSY